MSPFNILSLLTIGLALAGCTGMTASDVANVACVSAETASSVAAITASDVNAASNGVSKTADAERVANAVQKTVSDLCPVIASGASALTAAVAAPAASK